MRVLGEIAVGVAALAINEEALLLAKFLRDEQKTWIPRIVVS